MNEGEGASPAEQLAAEVASDESQQGGVTSDEVAKVLGLPKSGADNGGSDDDESGDDTDDDSGDDDAQDGAGDDSNDDDSGDDDSDEEDEEDDDDQETETADEKQFTLTVKDANGKEFTFSPDDDIEKALEDFEPKSNGQIFGILRDLQRLENEKAQYEADQEQQATDAAYQQRVTDIRAGWDSEIETLQGEKRIPVEADGKVPDRVKEVFKFMSEENAKRQESGRPMLESFEDALDKLELRESKDEAKQQAKKDKEIARKRGALVGGSSAPASSGSANPYRRGARTAVEALKQQGILR